MKHPPYDGHLRLGCSSTAHGSAGWCWNCVTVEQLQDYFDWIGAGAPVEAPPGPGEWNVRAYDPEWRKRASTVPAVAGD